MAKASFKKASTAVTWPYIFLDLDGVMADFDLHATEQGKRTADGRMKWDELDYNWWVTMPAFKGAREFYDAAKKLGAVKFLTGQVVNADCFSGKAKWVQNFLPERGKAAFKELIICPSTDKHFLAGPDRILVDDREQNIREWNEAGGIGILHKGDFNETMKAVEAAVSKIKLANTARSVPKPIASPRVA